MPVAACKSGVGKGAPMEFSYMSPTTFVPAVSRIPENDPSDTNRCPMQYPLDVSSQPPKIPIVLPKLYSLPYFTFFFTPLSLPFFTPPHFGLQMYKKIRTLQIKCGFFSFVVSEYFKSTALF